MTLLRARSAQFSVYAGLTRSNIIKRNVAAVSSDRQHEGEKWGEVTFPWENRSRDIVRTWSWVGSTAYLDVLGKRKLSLHLPGINPRNTGYLAHILGITLTKQTWLGTIPVNKFHSISLLNDEFLFLFSLSQLMLGVGYITRGPQYTGCFNCRNWIDMDLLRQKLIAYLSFYLGIPEAL